MDTFCVLPWYSKEYRENTTVCCLLPKNYKLDQIKQDLMSGIKNESCDRCWKIENSGQQSRRQLENKFLDFKLNRDLWQIRQDCVDNKNQTVLYQIMVSNLCNQACVSCNKNFSTKWGDLEYKKTGVKSRRFNIDLNNLDIDYTHAKRIEFVGGEPFYDEKTFKILAQLIAHNNLDCYISIVTNGSVKLTQAQLKLLSQFTNLNVCISIDGIGPVFEYMRWPGKWQNLVDNVDQYRNSFQVSVSYTISGLNAYYYEQTTKWFIDQKLLYNHNIVNFPLWLNLDNTPMEIKKHFSDSNFVSNWKQASGKEISLERFRLEILNQDQIKRISIKDYMPELADIIFGNQ